MRPMWAWSLVWGTLFVAALIAPIQPSVAANCALYARAETGVALYGAAGGWWDEAAGRYQRGHVPAAGAILVFKRTRHIPSGHVAVVGKVIGAHEILVDQANWYRGTVSHSMSVIDTSPDHDWTSVAVIDLPSGKYGRDNPTYGFVYPRPYSPELVEASAGDRANIGLLHLAAFTEDQQGSIYTTEAPGAHRHYKAAAHSLHTAPSAHAHKHAVSGARHAYRPRLSHATASSARTAAAHHRPSHAAKTTEAKHHRA